MAVDKNKIVAEATRFVQKGQYDKAIKAYEKILAEDKKEVRILLKIGEIQQKKADSPGAASTFNQVAEIYGEQGFFLKAVAVYKQIAKLTPDDVRVNEKLAGLYQQLGLLNDATNQLQAVATAFEKAGDQGRHLDVLRRLLDLDPENVLTCQRLGDLYAKANRGAEALELYHRAAAHLRENKRGDEYVKLAERIFALTPDDLKLAKELAQEYLARGETKKALGKLQICHGSDKQDVDTLRLMAQAFRDLGQVSKTIAVYRALARVYAERGRRDEAALTWRMVQELLPDDPEASEELAASGQARPPAPTRPAEPAAAPRPPGPAPPREEAAPSRPVAPRPPETRVAPPQVTRPQVAAPVPAQNPVDRILTETDVYLKYGLHQKALDHVEKLLLTDPENPDALERIRDIREALGNREGAAEAAERAVRSLLERGEEGRIAHAIERLRQLDPGHALAGEMPPPDDEHPVAVLDAVPDDASPDPEAVVDEQPPATELPPVFQTAPGPEPLPEAPAVPQPGPDAPVLRAAPDEDALKAVTGPEGPAPVPDDESPATIEAYANLPAVLGDDSPLPVDDTGTGIGVGVAAPDLPSTRRGDRRGRAGRRRAGGAPHPAPARAGPPAAPGANLGAPRRRDGGGRVLRAAGAPRRGAPGHPGAFGCPSRPPHRGGGPGPDRATGRARGRRGGSAGRRGARRRPAGRAGAPAGVAGGRGGHGPVRLHRDDGDLRPGGGTLRRARAGTHAHAHR